jgi:tRNA (guanine-N7-)-methyltransferase
VAKQKLKKFADINFFANVVQPELRHPVDHFHLRGNWGRGFFKNDHPIILEVGCGKGEYTIGLAGAYPENNYIGIDIKGDRLWTGAKQALKEGIPNVAFLRMQAERLTYMFAEGEISGIWLSFPDPHERGSRRKKRLTSPQFLERFRQVLKPGSPIHLKTDNRMLFEYTLEVIREGGHRLGFSTTDLYAEKGLEKSGAREENGQEVSRGREKNGLEVSGAREENGQEVSRGREENGQEVPGVRAEEGLEESMIRKVRTYYENKFLEQGLPIHYLRFSLALP